MDNCAVHDDYHFGEVIPHHPKYIVRLGKNEKSPDSWCIPMCAKHHAEFHDFSGYFRGRSKAQMAAWEKEHSAGWQAEQEEK